MSHGRKVTDPIPLVTGSLNLNAPVEQNPGDWDHIRNNIPRNEGSDHHRTHGKTKTLGPSRKVSRLDDKYNDDVCDLRSASGTKMSHHPPQQKAMIPPAASHEPGRRRPNVHDATGTRHELWDTIDNRGAHRAYGESTLSATDRTQPYSMTDTNITDSRAVRETQINFINDQSSLVLPGSDVRWDSAPTAHRFTHVDITVPGAGLIPSSNPAASKYSSTAMRAMPTNTLDYNHDRTRPDPGIATAHLAGSHNLSASDSSDSYKRGSKHKRASKKDQDSIMANLLGTIQQQRLSAQGKGESKENREYMLSSNDSLNSKNTRHNEDELVVPKMYDLYSANEKPATLRKVAAGPSIPSYKGFSEIDSRPRLYNEEGFDRTRRSKSHDRRPKKEAKRKTKMLADKTNPERPDQRKASDNVITTASWRKGQELIRRELGTVKVKTRAKVTEKQQSESDLSDVSQHAEIKPRSEQAAIHEEPERDVGLVPPQSAVLSDEARNVLDRLQLDDDDSDHDEDKGTKNDEIKEQRRSAGVKRKATKHSETERQQPMAKVRHYNQGDIRKYIAGKKADRLQKQKADREADQQAKESVKKQLDDLKMKAKPPPPPPHVTQPKKSKESKSKGKLDETFTRSLLLSELPKHHPFQKERTRLKVSSDSDLRSGSKADDSMDVSLSDGSSTVTGDSMDDTTPINTPRAQRATTQEADPSASKVKKPGSSNLAPGGADNPPAESLDMDALMPRLTEMASGQRTTGDWPAGQSLPPAASGGQRRTKSQRILDLKATAATLRDRIQSEAARTNELDFPASYEASYPGTVSDSRWAQPRYGARTDPPTDIDRFWTRHDRMTGANEDLTVFKSNLPGVQSLGEHIQRSAAENAQQDAATRIQAAYRGHTVRRSMNWQLPSGQTLGASLDRQTTDRYTAHDDESSLLETSTFSDITITDSEGSLATSPNKLGTALKSKDYHAGSKPPKKPQADFPRPRPFDADTELQPHSGFEQDADPYSVINVFRRHYKRIEKEKEKLGVSDASSRGRPMSTDQTDAMRLTVPNVTGGHVMDDTSRGSSLRSRSPGDSHVSEASAASHKTASSRGDNSRHAQKPHSNPAQSHHSAARMTGDLKSASVSFKPMENDDESTLSLDSYSQSFESDDELKSKSRKSHSVSEKATTRSARSRASKLAPDSCESDLSSLMDDESRRDPLSQASKVLSQRLSPHPGDAAALNPSRLSPNSLERRLTAELKYQDGIEESLRQLSNVDRTRALSMAQQETVSLAQVLKARQQTHDRDMKLLQLKAREEALVASRQLDEVRQRSTDAGQTAAKVIAEYRATEEPLMNETTRRLIETQADIAKTTAEAARYLADVRRQGPSNRAVLETATAAATAAVAAALERSKTANWKQPDRPAPDSARTLTSRYTDDFDTESKSASNTASRSADSVRAAGTSRRSPNSGESSVKMVTGAEGRDESKTESISDELSLTFDESMTEDEIEERSFRSILPVEVHRRESKRRNNRQDSISGTSDDLSVDNSHLHLDLFTGGGSFHKFTSDIVKKYMREEELRAQHQAALLSLREKALKEKTEGEFAFLEQKKQQLRYKGADDAYPQIVKKQRGIVMKLQQQQAEIKRMQEANSAASKERQKLFREHVTMDRKKNALQKSEKTSSVQNSRLREVQTEDDLGKNTGNASETQERASQKDYKSDSEIYADLKAVKRKKDEAGTINKGETTTPSGPIDKLKKIHLDERYLTVREQKLHLRRKNAEELLAWKRKLDDEEARVFKLEKHALNVWDVAGGSEKPGKATAGSQHSDAKKLEDDNVVTEQVSEAQDESQRDAQPNSESETSVIEDITKKTPLSDVTLTPEKHYRSGSDSSVPEEVPSQSTSVTEEVTPTSRPPTAVEENSTFYDQESFEQETPRSSKKNSPLQQLRKNKLGLMPGDNTLPFKFSPRTRGSESESEDSVSHTETPSDASDIEGRIRALKEQIRKRQNEADRLKREQKRRTREQLKAQEQSLVKQIQALDNTILELNKDLKSEMEHEPKGVKPKIKQQRLKDVKHNRQKQKPASPSDSESIEDGTDSNQTSPVSVVRDEKTDAQASPKTDVSKTILESISEASEPSRSTSKGSTEKRIDDTHVSHELSRADSLDDSSVRPDSSASERSYSDVIPLSPVMSRKVAMPANVTSAKSDEPPSVPPLINLPNESEDAAIPSVLSPTSVRSDITENIPEDIEDDDYFKPLSDDFVKPLDIGASVTNVVDEPSRTSDRNASEKYGYEYSDDIFDAPSTQSNDSSLKSEGTLSRPMSEKSVSAFSDTMSEDSATSVESASHRQSLSPEKTASIASEEDVPAGYPTKPSPLQNLDDLLGIPVGDDPLNMLVNNVDDETTPVQSPRENTQPILGSEKQKMFNGEGYKSEESFSLEESAISSPHDRIQNQGRSSSESDSDEKLRTLTPPPETKENDKVVESPPLSPKMERPAVREKAASALQDNLIGQSISHMISIRRKKQESLTSQQTSSELSKNNRGAGTKTKDSNIVAKNSDDHFPLTNGNIEDILDSPPQQHITDISAKQNAVADAIFQNNVDVAVSDLVDIRNKKDPTRLENFENIDSFADEPDFIEEDLSLAVDQVDEAPPVLDVDFRDRVTDATVEYEMVPRPVSPIPEDLTERSDQKQLDDAMLDLIGGEFMEEDDIYGSTVAGEPPPPYPDQAALYKMEIQKLAEEPFCAIPTKRDDVEKIIDNAVSAYWQCRRYGEPLNTASPPENYYSDQDTGQDNESYNRRTYKKLLFGLTGEIIQDIYKDESAEDPPPWQKAQPKQQRYYKGQNPPTNLESLKQIVMECVIELVGVNGTNKLEHGLNKWNISKKRNLVDNILVQELRAEEPSWVNYDGAELHVKMQISDYIINSLLDDTVQCMNTISQKKHVRNATQQHENGTS